MPKKLKQKRGFIKRVVSNTRALASIQKSKHEGKKADHDRETILQARAFDDAPNFENGQTTDAFKARFMANEVKKRRMKKAKK